MVSAKSPELPPGWTEHVKVSNGRKLKYYVNNGENDKKFYSKLSVLRHVGKVAGSSSQETPQPSNEDKKEARSPSHETPQPSKEDKKEAGSPSHKTPHPSQETSQPSNEDKKESPGATVKPQEVETSGSQEWLPPGWTVEVKTRISGSNYKCYINNETGKKFYSKTTAMRYIENGAESLDHGTPHQIGQDNETTVIGQDNETTVITEATPLAMKAPESLNWLPHGWNVEVKTKSSGQKYKVYVDPKTGSKFYSKPEVFKYLKTANQNSGSSELETKSVSNPHMDQVDGDNLEDSQDRKKLKGTSRSSMTKRKGSRTQSNDTPDDGEVAGNTPIAKLEDSQILKTPVTKQTDLSEQPGLKPSTAELESGTDLVKPEGSLNKEVSKQTNGKVVVERVTAEGLPPGWIKELKIEKKASGVRRDSFFTDLASGYVFRSQKDALRFVKTGDINQCAMRPKKREEIGFLSEVASKSLDINESDGKVSQHLETMNETSGTFTEKQTDLPEQRGKKPTVDKSDGGTSDVKSENTQNRKKSKLTSAKPTVDKSDGGTSDVKSENTQNGEKSKLTSAKPTVDKSDGGTSDVKSENTQNQEKSKLTSAKVVIERVTADGLPPGWIKEVKVEKRASGTRRDSYFTDPVSRYVFRSQKDALRYVDTGDINGCVMRPKKREELGFLSEEALESPPPAADTEDLEPKIQIQLFGGKENGGEVSPTTPDIEKKDAATETPNAGRSESNGLITPSPKTEDSKTKQGKGVSRRNSTKAVQDKKVSESKKPTNSSKSKRKNENELPSTRRTSRRLVGPNENEPKPSPGNTDTVVEDQQPPIVEDQQPIEEETEKKDQTFEHPFGDSWSDPCLEFAIKTLTGTLPDMDQMETEFPFMREVGTSSNTKVDSCLTLLDFNSNIPPGFEQVSAKPDIPPGFEVSARLGTPSCSKTAPPQRKI